jgi:hypothetical protein
MPGARYSLERQAEAVAIARINGSSVAMQRTGIPRRTIDRWMANPSPAVAGAVEATRSQVAAKLWEIVSTGSEVILNRICDPKARLSDVAQAVRVAAEQHSLLTGGPTAINANLNVNSESDLTWGEARDLRRWLNEIEQADDEALEAAAARYRVILAGRPDLLEKPVGD